MKKFYIIGSVLYFVWVLLATISLMNENIINTTVFLVLALINYIALVKFRVKK